MTESNQPKFVTVDSILASRTKLKTKVLYTPDWGGYTLIIELTGKQRDAYEAELMSVKGKGRNSTVTPNFANSRAKLVAKCIVDPGDFDIVDNTSIHTPLGESEYVATLKEGKSPRLLFNSIQVNDLGDVSATTLQFVYDECRELSGISEKDVEELEGELKNDQNGAYGFN